MRKCQVIQMLITSVKMVKMFSNFHERSNICEKFEEIGSRDFTGHAQI